MTEEELRPWKNVLTFNHFDGIMSTQDYYKNKNQASCSLHGQENLKTIHRNMTYHFDHLMIINRLIAL